MIDQEKIQEWVREYLKYIQDISINEHVNSIEGYKFKLIDNFQKYFDLKDPDLFGMLEKSIEKSNLVVGAQYWPRNMLLEYAQNFPKETKIALENFLNEKKDVYIRLTEAVKDFDCINEKLRKKTKGNQNTYIGLRFLTVLLSYKYPEKYNAIKPNEWKFFARFINADFLIPKHTSVGEQYRFYEKYIEELRLYVKNREDIKKIKEVFTRGLSFDDSESHWITQDIIYITANLLSRKKSEQAENKEQSIEKECSLFTDFSDTEDNTGFVPLEKHLEEYIIKNWDIIDFGKKLFIYSDDDGTLGQQYITDVGVIDILAKDAEGNFVVMELKRAETKYHVVGQILNYITWVEENLASNKQKVLGMIVVGRADKTLKSAIKQVSNKVFLKEYRVKMTFNDPK